MRWAALIVCVVLCAASVVSGAQDAENAADHYRKAFAALPDTSDPQWAFLNNPEAVRLDANTADFVRRHDATFAHLRAGAAIQRCDWGVESGAGTAAKLPHLNSTRTLSNFARLRARTLFQQRRHAEAFDDLAALVGLARHIGADPFVIAKLVEAGVNLLMGYGQETPFVEMEDWKWYAYSDFDEAAAAAGMPRASHKLVQYLAVGRPVFGKQSCVTGQFYAYLTQDEVRKLHAAIDALLAKTPEMRDREYLDGFVVELQAAFSEVIESGQDLWARAS